jgi:hypothetical protein
VASQFKFTDKFLSILWQSLNVTYGATEGRVVKDQAGASESSGDKEEAQLWLGFIHVKPTARGGAEFHSDG